MISFPFEIPPSLYSYLEKFDDNPVRTTEKLENQLQRRGADPIGEFLLAWFYLRQEKVGKARNHAMRAKAMASGSPLMEFLPYFIQHPQSFSAWQPSTSSKNNQITELLFSHPQYPQDTDLDHLIEQISKLDPENIRQKSIEEAPHDDIEDEDEEQDDGIDDIISETIADIYEKQNRFKEAKNVYRKLQEYYPEHKEEYEKAIKRINQRIEREQRDQE